MLILNAILIALCIYLYSQTKRCSYTRLFNKGQFNKDVKRRMRRYNDIIVIIDIDKFKLINDTYGHAYGDQVIKVISNTIKDETRGSDRAYRIGGDEFAIISSDASVIDRIRRALNKSDISVSVGCGRTYEQADADMYQQKALHNFYNE